MLGLSIRTITISPTDQRIIRAWRSLRALFGLGLFLTFLGAVGSGSLLYLYWTRTQKEMVPDWPAWPKLPEAVHKSLGDSQRLHQVLATTNLPPTIVALCADASGRLASPDQRWEATDVITDASLPRNLLVWAATSGDHYVLHYERGGRAKQFCLVVVSLKKGETQPKIVWSAVGGRSLNYAEYLGTEQTEKINAGTDRTR